MSEPEDTVSVDWKHAEYARCDAEDRRECSINKPLPISKEELISRIKKDIQNVASIYPTAFRLYDEPLDRLAHRVAATALDYITVASERKGGAR